MFLSCFFQSVVRIFVAFSDGNEMHLFIPSKSQPRISFDVVHFPLPCCSFFMEIGLSSSIPVSCGSGKI